MPQINSVPEASEGPHRGQNYAALREYANRVTNPELRAFVHLGLELLFDNGDDSTLRHGLALHSYPVKVDEFLFGHRFLRRPKNELYPAVVDELVKINEDHGRVTNSITEFVGTGGIGSAKTTTALYTNAYQLYLLSCYKNPHAMFRMDSTSEILFIFQSLNASTARDVDYGRFREICAQSYYFTSVFPFRKDIESSLKFPNRIEAKPIGSDAGSIGQNVLGGLIDEVNFMAITEKSKRGRDGKYDQAKVIYEGVSRRIKSRFVNSGGMPGILCLVSSKNYPGEFTDIKLQEAITDPSIYIYDKRVWDIKPAGTFCGDVFQVFTGDDTRKPRLLTAEQAAAIKDEDKALIVNVPTEYKGSFDTDIIGSLRDIAGVGTSSRYPFILNTEKIAGAFGKVKSILSLGVHDFSASIPLHFRPEFLVNPTKPRWVHIDLSISGDCTGVACGHVSKFVPTSVAGGHEKLPNIVFDFILQVVPPRGDEIKIHRIREMIHSLRASGVPIKWVTFDSFQSVDSIQLLRQQGFTTGKISTDVTPAPYILTKNALYDGRVSCPEHPIAQKELAELERNVSKGKIDHPPTGSKDCSDAIASVIYGLTTRREVWMIEGIPLFSIPTDIRTIQDKGATSVTSSNE